MNRRDYSILFGLTVLAAFIWLRNTSWMSSSDDTLPILVALPLFYWLGRPWNLTETPDEIPTVSLVIGVALFLIGIVADFTLLLAIAWTYFLWLWLSGRMPRSTHSNLKKLLVLPIMAFPWITLDMQALGWWFRLSGAKVTGHFFAFFGFDVQVEGTNILINSFPISVEAACSGLNTLQSMLIAGSFVAYVLLGSTNRYWWNLPVLVVMAWLANTLRIILLSAVALAYGRDFAMGWFHMWGGWFVLVTMFGLCWLIFQLQEPKPPVKQVKKP